MTEVVISDGEKTRIEAVWAIVFSSSNQVLRDAKLYGFEALGDLPSPNIHDMVKLLKVIGAMIDALYAFDQPYEQQRQLLNAKSQITNMERLGSALLAGERGDYEEALAALEKQCVI
ncbi:hypothetical protein [Rhizobacter sp. Root404]|uniref:hypothetical protein n=1 Tax=Rhizobacter sp. Root404 TaxID=1736528 RepID=UPI0006FB536F|nr:hypothetical protein [Rhizobacter sp. Root404]KQW38562.1 hypothetical protein ASC76_11200 [Rhizobacter sp. Root404]